MQTTRSTIDRRIRAGLLLFWALYFSIVCLSNTTDALKALNLLPPNFRFVSGNYSMVSKVVGIYGPTAGWAGFFFAGVISWEGVGAVLFWRALAGSIRETADRVALAYQAFGVTIGLWAAFIISDEVFLAYEFPGLSSTFFNLLIAELGSFILLRLSFQDERA
ncbi:hypothetical protein [Fibrella forsythiae]|uniref:Uncharacterized protein n=1 Tax=Fibrella forsythiae TaxID=2817061 RepID=A0ABS3JEN8_9BACT|nr:hypothetical protein [Fibrella forsythiae]MBO0948450.1 hypothetical protein [Fibrella forsythiae]